MSPSREDNAMNILFPIDFQSHRRLIQGRMLAGAD
jgi:hypothetical protein